MIMIELKSDETSERYRKRDEERERGGERERELES
jgi:hypothetical protein